MTIHSSPTDTTDLTPYEVRNLVAHIEAAGGDEILHQLLALETNVGTNFWFEVKDKGEPGGYVADVQRALRRARRAVDGRVRAGEPAPDIALEVRYALLIASVRSAAGHLPMALLTAMVEKGLRSAEEVLAEVSQGDEGPTFEVIASLLPHLPEAVRRKQLRDVLVGLRPPPAEWARDERGDAVSALVPYLPADLIGEALGAARAIDTGSQRARALAALGPRLAAELRDDGVTVASELEEPLLRIAAFAALGIATSREALHVALADHPKTDGWERESAAILLASTLPPQLLGEVLAVTKGLSYSASVLAALAARLPDDLLPEAVSIVETLDDYDHPGEALAALAPRLSGAALRSAIDRAARFRELKDRVQALNELALRCPEHEKARILRSSLEAAERDTRAISGLDNEIEPFVRLAELLPEDVLPRALELGRRVGAQGGGTAVLVAVGERLSEPERTTVLRAALRDTWIHDEELRPYMAKTSGQVLAKLAVLLPGEVLPFILDDVRPAEEHDSSWERLSAVAPHLDKHELRDALRAVRELPDGTGHCAAIAGLANYLDEPDRAELLRASLDICGRIRQHWDRTMALHALAPKLSEDLGAEALEIAASIPYEAGARARAEAAGSVAPGLVSRAVAIVDELGGYSRWKAEAYAALAIKADEPTKTELFRQAVATVGITDWDDTLALDVGFIAEIAPNLSEEILGEALDRALNWGMSDGRKCVSALAALARRFDGARRTAILERALAIALDIDRDSDRVEALIELGAEVPSAAEAIRQVGDPKWRAVGLVELGEPLSEEAMRAPTGLSDPYEFAATLKLLPFAPPDWVRAMLAEIRENEERSGLDKDHWQTDRLAEVIPRLGADLLPDLVDMAGRIPPSGRPPVLAAVVDTFRPLAPQQLHECWVQARAALDGVSRAEVLQALATLAPVVDAVGGRTGVRDSAASVLLVHRWHPSQQLPADGQRNAAPTPDTANLAERQRRPRPRRRARGRPR